MSRPLSFAVLRCTGVQTSRQDFDRPERPERASAARDDADTASVRLVLVLYRKIMS